MPGGARVGGWGLRRHPASMLTVPRGLSFLSRPTENTLVVTAPPNLLADLEEIDLSASVTAKLVFASVKMTFSETAIPNINQVSITDMRGK